MRARSFGRSCVRRARRCGASPPRRLLEEGGVGRQRRRRRRGGRGGGALEFPVEVASVESRPVEYTVTAVGSVEAFERVEITSRVPGAVERVHFSEGNVVGPGSLLVEIEPERYRLAVRSARATLEKAQAAEAEAMAGLKRREMVNAQNPGAREGRGLDTWRTRVLDSAGGGRPGAVGTRPGAAQPARRVRPRSRRRRDPDAQRPDRPVRPARHGARDPRPARSAAPALPGAGAGRRAHPPRDAGAFRVRDSAKQYTARSRTSRPRPTDVAHGGGHGAGRRSGAKQPPAGRVRPGDGARRRDGRGAGHPADRDPPERARLPRVRRRRGRRARARAAARLRTADGQVEVKSGVKRGEKLVVRGAEALRDGAKVRVTGPGAAPVPTAGSPGESQMKLTDVCIKKPVFAWMLMAGDGRLRRRRRDAHRHQPVPRRRLPDHHRQRRRGRARRPRSIENDVVEPLEEALDAGRGRAQRSPPSSRQGGGIDHRRARPRARRRPRAAGRADQGRAGAARLPRDIDPPVDLEDRTPRISRSCGSASPARSRRSVLADYARYRVKEKLQTVPGVGEITLGGYLERNVRIWLDADAARREGPDRQRRHRRAAARARRAARRPPRDRGPRGERARPRRGARPRRRCGGIVVRETSRARRSTSRTSRSSRTASRTSAASRASTASRRRASASTSSAARTRSPSRRACKARSPRSRRPCRAGMELGINFDSTQFIEESVHEIELELLLVGAPDRARLLAVPRLALEHAERRPGDPDVAARHGRRHLLPRLHAQHVHAARPGARRRHRRRRRDHGAREHLPPRRDGEGPRARGARGHRRRSPSPRSPRRSPSCAIFLPVVFMKGVIGKFFLQFGVTLCVAVLLSYLEAITLAPARCAQMLDDVARGPQPGSATSSTAASSGSPRRYARVLARGLRRPALVLLVAAVALFVGVDPRASRSCPSEFVPSQDQSRLMIRLQTAVGSDLAETDALFRRAEAFVDDAARGRARASRSSAASAAAAGEHRHPLRHAGAAATSASSSQQEFAGVVRKELNAIPGVRAVVQDLSQQGFTAQRGFPVEFSVRGPDWDKLVELASESMRDEARRERHGRRPRHRLPARHARAAHHPRPRPRRRPRRPDRGRRHHDQRARRRRPRRQVQRRRAAHRHAPRGCSRRSARAPRTSARLRVRSRVGELVPLSSLVTTEERPALQAITRRDRERAITDLRQRRAGHVAGRGARGRRADLARTLPAGYRAVLGGASVAFRESMGEPGVRAHPRHHRRVHGPRVAVQLVPAPGHGAHDPAAVDRRRGVRAAGSPARRLNIFSMIGLLLLMGIVKKNSIILVDYANQARARGPRTRATRCCAPARCGCGRS